MALPDTVRLILWFLPVVLQLAIAALMLRRRLIKVFPMFFVYTALMPIRDVLQFAIRDFARAYFFVYWIAEAVSILASILVSAEITERLVDSYSGFKRLLHIGFVVIGSLALAAGVYVFIYRARQESELIGMILLAETAARILQVVLLVLIILAIAYFGLTWCHYTTGIALGFGVAASLQLMLAEVRGSLQLISNNLFTFLKPAAYNLAVLIWAWYFIAAANRKVNVPNLPSTEIARWNDVLKRFLNR